MIRGIWQFEVAPEKQDDYLEATATLIKPYWESQACLSYEVYQDRENPRRFFKMQVYKNQQDLDKDAVLLSSDPGAQEAVQTFRSFAENVTPCFCDQKC